jgi:hypothetical protein
MGDDPVAWRYGFPRPRPFCGVVGRTVRKAPIRDGNSIWVGLRLRGLDCGAYLDSAQLGCLETLRAASEPGWSDAVGLYPAELRS